MRPGTAAIAALAILLTAPLLLSAQLEVTSDVVYGHKDGLALTYDVVQPTTGSNGAAVVYMVSGGWVSRWRPPEVVATRRLFRELIARGFTLFFVRHGSSPRFKVPEAIADVRLAVAHIREHARDHGVDPARLGLTGMSAGGHLSLAIGLRAEGPDEAAEDGENGRPNQVAAIVAYFPPVDLRGWSGPNERFPALDFDEAQEVESSPILSVTPDDPPTLLLHGDEDRLVPVSHSERLHGALKEVGAAADLVVFPGAGHGFRGNDEERAVQLTADWFERFLLHGAAGR